MSKVAAVITLALLLSGCGGAPGPANLLVIGNSITLHGVNANIGWYGNWGMAASAEANDFAHLTAAALRLPVSVRNLGIEVHPEQAQPAISELASQVTPVKTVVVVELGDNAWPDGMADFRSAYAQLLADTGNGYSLLCLSTWWNRSEVDEAIEQECVAHGGLYVYIGDILTDPQNPDRQSTAFADPNVNQHPQDWGMARIAERVVAAIP
jgi:alpha-galactosidase